MASIPQYDKEEQEARELKQKRKKAMINDITKIPGIDLHDSEK